MTVQTPLSLDDYDAISAAVMETERGRWFLAEFARRNRAADTSAVLSALADLERALSTGRLDAPARVAGPDGERTAHLVRRIAERASLIRNELHRPADPQARITRAHSHLDKLDRLITLALSAVGAPPRATVESHARSPIEPAALPAPIDIEAVATTVTPAAERAESRTQPAVDEAEPAGADPVEAVVPADVEPVDAQTHQPAEQLAVFVNGHAIDILAEVDEGAPQAEDLGDVSAEATDWDPTPVFRPSREHKAGELEPDSEDAPVTAQPVDDKRIKMPTADAPLLLDSLSAETKAILFA